MCVDKDFFIINPESIPLRRFTLPACPTFLHTQLDQKQFVKTQAQASSFERLLIARVVDLRYSFGQGHQLPRGTYLCRPELRNHYGVWIPNPLSAASQA